MNIGYCLYWLRINKYDFSQFGKGSRSNPIKAKRCKSIVDNIKQNGISFNVMYIDEFKA